MQLQERIRRELMAIGFADPRNYMTVTDGQLQLRDWQGLDRDAMAAVAGVERSSTGLKVKLYDKMKALELLGRMLGLFEGGVPRQEDTNILEAIMAAGAKEVDLDDIHELQQTAMSGADLVAQAGDVAL